MDTDQKNQKQKQKNRLHLQINSCTYENGIRAIIKKCKKINYSD